MNKKIAISAILIAFVGVMVFAGAPVEAKKGGGGSVIDEVLAALAVLDERVTQTELDIASLINNIAENDCAADKVVAGFDADGTPICVDQTVGSDTLAALGCADNEIIQWDDTGKVWKCVINEHTVDTDTDTLAALGCAANQVAQYSGTDWICIDLVTPPAPPGTTGLSAQLFLVGPNGVNTKTTTVIMVVTNTGDVALTDVTPVSDCDDMWFVSPAGGLEDISPCSLDAISPVILGPGETYLFKWDGTVAGDIDDVFLFCNSASGEGPVFTSIISNISCDSMTVIDPNDCGGCETLGTLTNYYRSLSDADGDGDILCDVGDIALSAWGTFNSNSAEISPLSADDVIASSGDSIVGYRMIDLAGNAGISCLDLP